jgi:hypothetical protein
MDENATVISQALKAASGASIPRVCFPMPRGSSALYGFLGAIEIFAQPTVKEQAVLLDNKGAHHARLPA